MLTAGRGGLDRPDNIHAISNRAECREALTVNIAAATEIEFGLVVDADKELGDGTVGGSSAHREGAVGVPQASVIALRSEPLPLSLVLITVKSLA